MCVCLYVCAVLNKLRFNYFRISFVEISYCTEDYFIFYTAARARARRSFNKSGLDVVKHIPAAEKIICQKFSNENLSRILELKTDP